jgi:hypothetical protein
MEAARLGVPARAFGHRKPALNPAGYRGKAVRIPVHFA